MFSELNLIENREQWDAAWSLLDNESLVSFDTETTGLEYWKDLIVGFSFGNLEHAWYCPIRHVSHNMPIKWLHEAGERLDRRLVVGHNILGFDYHLLRREGWKVPALCHDSQIAGYTLDENQELKLEAMASKHLGFDGFAEERDLYVALARALGLRLGATKKVPSKYKASMGKLEPKLVAPYACRDALSSRRLMQKFWTDLGNAGLRSVYQSLIEYDRVLHDMREVGVHIDLTALNRSDAIVAAEAERCAQEIIRQAAGKVENPRSNVQLAKWCGTDSVSKKKLEKVLKDPDVDETLPAKIELIRERALYDKAHGTYYLAIRECADAQSTGLVLHPALRLTGAAVRLSCGRPPMQGIPRYGAKTHPAYKGIKECIVAPPDRVFVEFDLSQAEMVMDFFYSRDPNLEKVLRSGASLHDIVAAQMAVDRDAAKTANFALKYGAGAKKYAEMRMIPFAQAQKEVEAFHQSMKGMHQFYKDAQKMAVHHGKVVLWSGRVRHFNEDVKSHSASNAYSQGGVSELLRVATVLCYRKVPEFRIGLSVHDCNAGDLPACPKQQREIIHEVKSIMSDFSWLDPGIKADCKVSGPGGSWASAKHYE